MESVNTMMVLVYGGIFLVALLASFGMFFYQAYNTSKLSKMAGFSSPWMAYIPALNMWLRASVGHESKNRAITSIVLKVLSVVLVIVGFVLIGIGSVVLFGSMDTASSDAALNGFMAWIGAGVVAFVLSIVLSLIGRFIVSARIDMAFVEAFEVEAGVAALTVNNFRAGWAYANLLSRIASQMEKGLKYRYEAPAF